MTASMSSLARRQLSTLLAPFVHAATSERPRSGWLRAIRESMEMSLRQFADRLGISPSNALRLERREAAEGVTLATLREAADALGFDLVYALVPRERTAKRQQPNRLLDGWLQAQLIAAATLDVQRTAHTMRLQGQEVPEGEIRAQIDERAAALASNLPRVWDLPGPHGQRTSAAERAADRHLASNKRHHHDAISQRRNLHVELLGACNRTPVEE